MNTELIELKQKHFAEDEGTIYKTALVEHAVKNNHIFDFDGVRILFHVDNQKTRKSFESLAITMEGYNSCNFKTDTQYLNIFTKQLIHSYKFHSNKSKQRRSITSDSNF